MAPKGANNPGPNRMLLRMLEEDEEDMPDGCVTESFAISDKDFEDAIRKSLETDHAGPYDNLIGEAGEVLGSTGKPLRAKFVAERLATMGIVSSFVAEIVAEVATLAGVDLGPPQELGDEGATGEASSCSGIGSSTLG